MEEEARHAEAVLRTWQPELAPRYHRALCRLLAPRATSPEILIHGDLHPDQVLIERVGPATAPHATVIDWDGAGRAPAEADLGNFLAHVELEAVRGHWPRAAASAMAVRFLRGYQQVRSYEVVEVARFRDLALLRLAGRHADPAFGKCPPNPPGLAGALLERVEAAATRVSE
jgi:aminoglycoside phosphotransferase (APT) family kinase protein